MMLAKSYRSGDPVYLRQDEAPPTDEPIEKGPKGGQFFRWKQGSGHGGWEQKRRAARRASAAPPPVTGWFASVWARLEPRLVLDDGTVAEPDPWVLKHIMAVDRSLRADVQRLANRVSDRDGSPPDMAQALVLRALFARWSSLHDTGAKE